MDLCQSVKGKSYVCVQSQFGSRPHMGREQVPVLFIVLIYVLQTGDGSLTLKSLS